MRRVLSNTSKTKKYLETLPKLYIVGLWASYGVRVHYFSGKCDLDGMPLVYDYYDGNGTCDEWRLYRLDHTTTGCILAWTTEEAHARAIVNSFEK